ncbi:MAG TPA: iron ABC transporter substrate-binding protein [Cyanobacteria bacterium UBA11149]|nr:iron ABC transporter substrate-binding protein [Cyanobacteria bacterium UBA11367]HBE61089.1 iron ABC transporter substrate-binding protein [Cyanobacteria bacterium UBA11366]HBK62247.1 iron ABC transporter substrate-binding protein [Cyanobacteria bacterium UBA11166]HBR73714.1 iron ABC transporter substrate-binding protein [Cyanobacteria bacterium UBA11159]HBS72682.1 iron ABC transporter substrate-binding protein [Cyanobacteria bacterium UBA11153]HBW89165.1 iron ABC transporter substrate-bind
MEFSIATLLSNFTDDKLVAPKVLEKKLGCQDEASIQRLQIALDALERIGILIKDRGRYRRVYEEDVVEAKLRCSSKGFCFAIQEVEGADDIYIQKSHLSSAWNGDRVLVKITKEGSRRRSPEGQVRLILERANPSVLARVKQTEEGYRAVPLDDRLLFELDLKQNSIPLAEAVDHLVHVEVVRYPLGPKPPLGKVASILGSDAEDAEDTDIVCCKHDLRREFGAEILKAVELIPKQPRKTDFKKRLDLRHLFTISIEGNSLTNCQVENAFTITKTQAGHWQLGIHITDVGFWIPPGSPLDKEARKRSTTVYLGDLVLPLLPEAAMSIFSLVPGEDRLTISVLLTLDRTGELLEFEIHPTIIQVNKQLTIEEAQSLLVNRENVDPELAPLVDMLNLLFLTLSPAIRARRQQRGSFDLNLSESKEAITRVRPPYKDEGRVGAIIVSSSQPLLSLLTELIVLANQAVAVHLQSLGVPAIYAVQSAPDIEQLEDTIKLANNLGIDLQRTEGSSFFGVPTFSTTPQRIVEEITAQDYQHFTQIFSKSTAPKVLTYLLQSTLKPVTYSSKPGTHFGLALETPYTHCTSPMWRYSDLFVQQILNLVFEEGRDRRTTRSKERVNLNHSSCQGNISWSILPTEIQQDWELAISLLIPHLNDREKIAEDAELDLQGLKKAEHMKERTGEIFSGLITGVQSYGFFVEIEDLLVEGLVHVSSLKDDWYEYRSRHSCLVGRKNRTAYRLGDKVEVQVKSVDYYRQQIDLVTVSGGSVASSEDLED